MITELWQALDMGNKDARKREVKKPKKKKLTPQEINQAAARLARLATEKRTSA